MMPPPNLSEVRILTIPVALRVNGRPCRHDVEPRLLLVHYLRDVLGLTGTKVACDTSQCGSCTVLVDGVAVKSCTCLAVQADGAEVTTIEGMTNEDGSLSPVQAPQSPLSQPCFDPVSPRT